MARISYDEPTAAAFKGVREVPRDGLSEWREGYHVTCARRRE